MKFRFMEFHRSEFRVKKMCQTLGVSRGGFDKWCKRSPSKREVSKRELKKEIATIFEEEHGGMAGSPTITADLKSTEKWKTISRTKVAGLMKEMNLKCRTQKKWVNTTDSKHALPVAPNILNRSFEVAAPNTVWVSDITYLSVNSRWMYLCVFIDLYARRVVGWRLSETMHVDFVVAAFQQAVAWRKPQNGLIVHSDRGIQYAASEFRSHLILIGANQSMSRKGNCWDNAVAESFFHSAVSKSKCNRLPCQYRTIHFPCGIKSMHFSRAVV